VGASSTPAEIYSKPLFEPLLRVIFHRKTAKKVLPQWAETLAVEFSVYVKAIFPVGVVSPNRRDFRQAISSDVLDLIGSKPQLGIAFIHVLPVSG
jgi:hypothetical protein